MLFITNKLYLGGLVIVMKENALSYTMGMRIAEIRRSHNVTQETLAEILDVTPKHISHVECGTSTLSLKNLIQFCEIFHCSLDYIVSGKTVDSVLSRMPNAIVQILYSEDFTEIDRLNRYLQIYVELISPANN